MRIVGVGAALALALFFALPARADFVALPAPDAPDLIAVGGGAYDFLHQNPVPQLRLEYRFGYRLFFLEPVLGAFATEEGTAYTYGGVRADIVLADHFLVTPMAAVGYWYRGGGKDLGSHFEFKTGAEFAYRFDNDWRLGIDFDHISNAGITRTNPGVESLLLVLSVPLRSLLR